MYRDLRDCTIACVMSFLGSLLQGTMQGEPGNDAIACVMSGSLLQGTMQGEPGNDAISNTYLENFSPHSKRVW